MTRFIEYVKLLLVISLFSSVMIVRDVKASGVSSVSNYRPDNVTITGGNINGISTFGMGSGNTGLKLIPFTGGM